MYVIIASINQTYFFTSSLSTTHLRQQFAVKQLTEKHQMLIHHFLKEVGESNFGFTAVLVTRFLGKDMIPLLLDHAQFGSYIAVPFVDSSTTIEFFNNYGCNRILHRDGQALRVTGSLRYDSFLYVASESTLVNTLLIITEFTSNSCSCSCGGPYCMDAIESHPHENEKIQEENVNRVYNLLSSYFRESTTKFFKHVNSFIRSFSYGLLLDTGCGDCKYICWNEQNQIPSNRTILIGQDNNREMLLIDKYEQSKQSILVQNDICHLSFKQFHSFILISRENVFDGVLSVSVIQHLPNKYKQLQALRELIRVSKKGGRILIYVWSFEKANMKPRFEDPSQYQFLTWKLPLSSIGGKRDSIERDGFIVNEEENTVEVKRFFYLFIHGELEWLLSYCSGVRIVNRFFDGSNWCVELEVVKYIVSYQQRYLLHHY